MGSLTFVGLGLDDERGISVRGLEEASQADLVFAELYTSYLPHLSVQNLEKLISKQVTVLDRMDVEENPQETILDQARRKKVILLVPGDPMIATTHIDLRLRAEKLGIATRVIGAASIQTAAAALTGLQSYKFGRTITVPFVSVSVPESPYEFLKRNLQAGLHTLILLDLHADRKKYMTISEGLGYLTDMERRRRENVFPRSTLVVGIARAGADDMLIRAATVDLLGEVDFGLPPHCLIVPTKLHFMETEALKVLAKAEM